GVYVHERVARPFLGQLVGKTRALKVGDPTERDVVLGPVINAEAVARFERAVAQVSREKGGAILHGGERLSGASFERGHFVAPTIARLPVSSSLFCDELFVRFLAVAEVCGVGQGITEPKQVEDGPTEAIFLEPA